MDYKLKSVKLWFSVLVFLGFLAFGIVGFCGDTAWETVFGNVRDGWIWLAGFYFASNVASKFSVKREASDDTDNAP